MGLLSLSSCTSTSQLGSCMLVTLVCNTKVRGQLSHNKYKFLYFDTSGNHVDYLMFTVICVSLLAWNILADNWSGSWVCSKGQHEPGATYQVCWEHTGLSGQEISSLLCDPTLFLLFSSVLLCSNNYQKKVLRKANFRWNRTGRNEWIWRERVTEKLSQ